ncbi:MAG TPA: PadR family transcriptional regulator [Devosia sp.]|nr:PadR family transcriptional regulator [Devosia sp.]
MKNNQTAANRGEHEKKLTVAELMVLGLVAEMPRHGYQLEQVIKERGMREWTQIGFSSIYFVLGKLEKAGLVVAKKPDGAKAKKTYSVTGAGRRALVAQSLQALREHRPTYSSVLAGMAHWPVLDREAGVAALRERGEAIASELERLENIQFEQQPLPDFVAALFDHSLSLLRAEADWVKRTADHLEIRPEQGPEPK